MAKYKKQKPIFNQLFFIFSCFAIIPVIIIGVLGFWVSNQTVRRDLQRNIEDSLNHTAYLVDGELDEMRYIAESFNINAYLKKLLRLSGSDSNILLLEEELGKMNAININKGYYITLCGINGQIYTNWSTDGMIYRNSLEEQIKNMAWFPALGQAGSLPVWIPCMDNLAGYDNSYKVVSVAKNIMNDQLGGEKNLGFVMVSMASHKISEALTGTERTFVIAEDNTIVLSQEESEIGTRLPGIAVNQSKLQKIDIDGVSYIGGVKESSAEGLYTVVLVKTESLTGQLAMSVVTILVMVLLLAGCMFLAAYHFSKSLSKPIQMLEQSMQKVQYGELEKSEIETNILEIGGLADNYNRMIERIEGLIREKIAHEQKSKEIQMEKTNAELKFLRAQIMPHFLFNTLNSIKWLAVIHGAAPVEEMIAALGRLLECSMQKGRDFIPIKEEVENIQAYLKIQGMRYGNRLKTEYQIEEEIQTAIVPKLILQPLVENAIIHGIDKNPEGGQISIRICGDDDTVKVEIEDEGPGILDDILSGRDESPQERNRHLSGIGVGNVNKRIQMIYGESYGLYYRRGKENKGTIAVLTLRREEQHVEDTVGR